MFAFVLTAAAEDLSWTCADLATVADALPWQEPEVDAGDDLWDLLLGYVDTASCALVACDYDVYDEASCWGIDCTTAAGATVRYSYYWEWDWIDAAYTYESIDVVPPADAGESWTWAAAEREGTSGDTVDGEAYTFAWTGELAEGHAEDGTLATHWQTSYRDGTLGRGVTWSDPDCAWTHQLVDWSDYVVYDIEVNGVAVEVRFDYLCEYGTYQSWFGTFDGAFVGEVDPSTWEVVPCVDGDGDGECFEWGDCDDADAERSSCITEIPYDGIDQDCSGADRVDADGDGYAAVAAGGTDCDDEDRDVHPGEYDVAYDGVDQDCSGADVTDRDGDGYDGVEVGGPDCADTYASRHPGATEIGCDGIDQDCDGSDARCVTRPAFAPGRRPWQGR